MAGRHGPAPRIVRLGSLKAEAAHIAQHLKGKHTRGTPWDQMVVLYSARIVAEELTSALASQLVPFEWMKDRACRG